MSTDYRALCAELHTAVQLYTGQNPAAAETPANELVARLMAALAATAAALAQPEPEGVTEEWDAIKDRLWRHYETTGYQGERFIYQGDFDTALDVARQELARFARPAIEPEGVTARELQWPPSVAQGCHEAAAEAEPGSPMQQLLVAAGDLLENYARPTIEPVPVAERLPGPEDCDAERRCWWHAPETDTKCGIWCLGPGPNCRPPDGFGETHWLPHHALPIPTP
jgi:hypothetical protein